MEFLYGALTCTCSHALVGFFAYGNQDPSAISPQDDSLEVFERKSRIRQGTLSTGIKFSVSLGNISGMAQV